MELNEFTENLYLKDGIWFSKNTREISYPEVGNLNCYQIENDSFWFNHRNNCITETVAHYSPNDTFFDIGGGNGFVTKGLENKNIDSVLIEPGIAGALNAKKRGIKNIICATFEDAGIKPNYCKSIGLFDVVEHIEDDKQFLKSINSILADKGLLYITVPAFNFLWSKEDDDAGHYRRYTTKNISKLLKEVGFEIEYSTYIFSILPIPIFFFRTIPSLLRLNKKEKELDKYKDEHSQNKSALSSFLDKIWKKELDTIKQRKSVPFGGSCFIVARKKA